MLATHIGHLFEVLPTVDSTNLYAMRLLRAGMAQHGQAIFATEQTAGRGQRGKTWWSSAGENIHLSVILSTDSLSATAGFRVMVAMALGVVESLKTVEPNGWVIKWPNDLYYNDRKAGGILLENVWYGGKWQWAVAGIGINVNTLHFNPAVPNATSLRAITGEMYDPIDLAKRLCHHLETHWKQLHAAGGWVDLLMEYNQHLFGRGEWHRLRLGNSVASYRINGVDDQGHLLAGTSNEFRFAHGEVQWVLPRV